MKRFVYVCLFYSGYLDHVLVFLLGILTCAVVTLEGVCVREREMGQNETVKNAERLVRCTAIGRDASHDAAHSFRVRDLALSLAIEEGMNDASSPCYSPDNLEVVRTESRNLFPASHLNEDFTQFFILFWLYLSETKIRC